MTPSPGRAVIRLASDQDLESIHALERDAAARFSEAGFGELASPGGWPDEALRSHVAARRAWLAIDDVGAPRGFVLGWSSDGMAIVCELAVARSHGRCGYGRALVEAVADWGRGEALAAIGLATYRGVPWDVPFFASLGFRAVDEAGCAPWMRRQLERERRDEPALAARRVFMARQLEGREPVRA